MATITQPDVAMKERITGGAPANRLSGMKGDNE